MTVDEIKRSSAMFLKVKDVMDFFPGMSQQMVRCRIKSGKIPVEHFTEEHDTKTYLYIDRRSFIRLIGGET